MNERIRELAIQAGMIVSESNGFDRIRLTFSEVEFAELIVKECTKLILETPVEYLEIDAMHRVRDRVKNHFGVEE